MYRRFRNLVGDPTRRVIALAIVLIVAQLVFRGWAVYGSWFQFDDFAFMSRLMNDPMPGVFFREYAGHLMPAGFALTWLNLQVAELEWWLPATELLAMQAMASIGFLVLLLRTFGARKGILVPLAVYLASAITIPSFIWWAAGINQLPLQVALFWGALTHLAYLRSGQVRWAVTTMAITLGALAFYEKSLLLFVVYAFLALAYFAKGDLLHRVRSVVKEYTSGVVIYAVVGISYALVYVVYGLNFDPSRANETKLGPVAWNILSGFSTGIVGGPLNWDYQSELFANPAPTDLILAASLAVLALVVWEVTRTHEKSKRAWLLPGIIFVANVVLIGGGRASFVGPQIALDYRYQTELAALAALALALATMPMRGAREVVVPVRRSSLFDHPPRVATATALMTILATVSSAQFASHWRQAESAPTYFKTVERELTGSEEPVPLVDVHVPGFLMFAFGWPESSTQHVLRMFDDRTVFPSYNVDQMYMVADDGTVQPMLIDTVRTAAPSAAECPYRPRFGRTTIPLDGPVLGAGWWVRLNYGSDRATPLVIRAGDVRYSLEIPGGIHNVFFEVSGQFSSIELSGIDRDASVCIPELELGQPTPAHGPYER